MTPLPAALGGSELVAWRLDLAIHGQSWDSGEGAYLAGGRWNGAGGRAVYCSLDPSTTVLEAAVHRGFTVLDTTPHVLTSLTVTDPARVFVVQPDDVPNRNWLTPSAPSAGQQAFGDKLLDTHDFIVLPSVVSDRSWNLMFRPDRGRGGYALRRQEQFALDPRLHPPRPQSPRR
ncbi:MAG: RES domain-containing protein [Hyphomicrobiales bacterium]|nr:RES domain-containing protein [Hyphomicrobiales bacterium]